MNLTITQNPDPNLKQKHKFVNFTDSSTDTNNKRNQESHLYNKDHLIEFIKLSNKNHNPLFSTESSGEQKKGNQKVRLSKSWNEFVAGFKRKLYSWDNYNWQKMILLLLFFFYYLWSVIKKYLWGCDKGVCNYWYLNLFLKLTKTIIEIWKVDG